MSSTVNHCAGGAAVNNGSRVDETFLLLTLQAHSIIFLLYRKICSVEFTNIFFDIDEYTYSIKFLITCYAFFL